VSRGHAAGVHHYLSHLAYSLPNTAWSGGLKPIVASFASDDKIAFRHLTGYS